MSEANIKKRPNKKSKAKRKRARRNRRIFALCLCFIAVILVLGFAVKTLTSKGGERSDATLLTLKSDGSVVFEEVAELSSEYDGKALKEFVKAQVKAYVPREGSSVNLEVNEVSGNRAYVRTVFSDVRTYADFTGYEAYYGTLQQASSKGYAFESSFLSVTETEGSDGNKAYLTDEVSRDKILEDSNRKVFLLRENVPVAFEGKLKFISGEGTSFVGKKVIITPTDGNIDAPPLCYFIFDQENPE